jgi:hypothetical protein
MTKSIQLTGLIALLVLFAVGASSCGVFMQDKEGAVSDMTEVRQPETGGELEEFWDSFDWAELTPAEQALWGILGWDEASWQGEAEEPASEDKDWAELSDAERAAAEQLGYDQELASLTRTPMGAFRPRSRLLHQPR